VEIQANPFTTLTFIPAPAIPTKVSCVLLFGTGNSCNRTIDQVNFTFAGYSGDPASIGGFPQVLSLSRKSPNVTGVSPHIERTPTDFSFDK
jgi:hypothetical protein